MNQVLTKKSTNVASLMIASNGLLSQTITNLVNLNQQLGTLGNLPASAQGIQQSAQALFNTDVANLKTIQSDVLAYTTPTITQLNTALADLNSGNTTSAAAIATTANQGAKNLSGTVGGLLNDIMATKTQVISFSNSLSAIETDLQNQITSLNVQIQGAQAKVDQYNKEKYYFLALGPFGLVGLATAIALLATWNGKVNSLNSQISGMNAQISAAQMLITNVNSLIGNFNTAVTQISNINNSINFLSGDIQEVIDDLNNSKGGGTAQAILYLTTALHEVQTLATDAS